MPELTLVGMRVVVEVARTGSLSAAAQRLGYTQSGVSRQVALTEQAVGSPLFTRHARGVRPTPSGQVLLRHATRVLDSVSAMAQELEGMRDRLSGLLTVGGFPAVNAALLPRAVAKLLKTQPGLSVRLMQASTPTQLTSLRRGRLEVAVLATGEGLPQHDLEGLSLSKLRGGRGAGVAVAGSHPFALRDWVDPEELGGQTWIVGASEAGSPEFGAWPGIEHPVVAFTSRDWCTRLGLVAAGLGIAVVPGFAAPAVPQSVRWIPVRDHEGGLRRQVWAATAEDASREAKAMVEALIEEAAATE